MNGKGLRNWYSNWETLETAAGLTRLARFLCYMYAYLMPLINSLYICVCVVERV